MLTADEPSIERRPLHERVAADLRDEILSGAVAPGTVLTATGLRRRFAAPDATLERALDLLRAERLVTGRADPAEAPEAVVLAHRQRTLTPARTLAPAAPGSPYRWLTEARATGVRARIALLEVTAVPEPPPHVARALRLGEDGQAVLRSQLLLFDDEPVGLVKAYFPLDIARGTALAERRRIRGGISTLLAGLGHPPRRCVDSVSARVPTQEQQARLRLPDGMPVLRTFRVVYTDGDRPVEAHDTVEAGHLYELRYEFSQAR
ncbi:GntR family transcriptional regulator [Streptomyces sp. URMC 126]|uniref:GntR family transcriptional regulator n=1 Tax=Streptomyces sp. URMC 126 TaxID=3423401 RepID=UPI003F1A2E21